MTGFPASEVFTVATTGTSGVPLIDGTQTILSWTAPDDGKLHTVLVGFVWDISSSLTGGAVQANVPGKASIVVFSGGEAAGWKVPTTNLIVVLNSGDALELNQTSAATAGAATVYATFVDLT